MNGSTPRLGDSIDDYCPRCRLLLNHAIASMVDSRVAKVICRTCLTEHPFLHGDGGKKKKPSGGPVTLLDQVLAKAGIETEANPPPAPKKKSAPAGRYISRRGAKPRRRGR